jgi:hypothetical protein
VSGKRRRFDVSDRFFEKRSAAKPEPAEMPSPAAAGEGTVETAFEAAAKAPAKEKQSTRLLALAADADLFHTPPLEPYVSFRVGDHIETWPVGSKTYRHSLRHRYFLQVGSTPSKNALQEAIDQLTASALFDGPEQVVATRIAGTDEAIYANLADPRWQCVEISKRGWRVISDPPLRFRRPEGMTALPLPVRGGNLDELRSFTNAPDEMFRLIVAWLLAAFRPRGPYPILAVHGEPGSSKTTLCNILRLLLDPNLALQRTLPNDERDLMITARNSWFLAFDNLSRMTPRISDAFCRMATGGGFSTRTLYSDDGEKIFEAQRPVVFNGIEELNTRGDLADRTIVIMLESIPAKRRIPEEQFWAKFEEARPRIFGALLDAVVVGLNRLPDVQLDGFPRMADFTKWSVATEPAYCATPGGFLAAYENNRAQMHELTLESSPVAAAVFALAEHGGFFGTATELLTRLHPFTDKEMNPKEFPKDGPRLAGALRRIAPHLRARGIGIDFSQPIPNTRSSRGIRIAARNTVATVEKPASPRPKSPGGAPSDSSDSKNLPCSSAEAGTGLNPDPASDPDTPPTSMTARPAEGEQQTLDDLIHFHETHEHPNQ